MSTKSHYSGHSAESYESVFFYSSGEYTEWLSNLVKESLGISTGANSEKRRLLDVGGGTGNFTEMVIRDRPNIDAVVLDPFLAKGGGSNDNGGDAEEDKTRMSVKFVKDSADVFLKDRTEDDWWRKYDMVLVKEVIHHIPARDRANILSGIYNDLSPSKDSQYPNLLIVTRPYRDIDYPLWREAKDVWAANQPAFEEIAEDLKKAGFTSVSQTIESYPCKVALRKWQAMIKGRFWSTFSNFSDAQLEEACERIAAEHVRKMDGRGNILFEDRLLFITAMKL